MEPVLTIALLAGAVAALNPCGFALLPAYVTLAVTGDVTGSVGSGAATRTRALTRALVFTAGMTVGFVLVFGLFALLIGLVGAVSTFQRYSPYVIVAVGVALVLAGIWLLLGRELPGLPRVSVMARGGAAPSGGLRSYVLYGITFALASLSCTLGPFLVVVTQALQLGGLRAVLPMVVYAVGMGAVVGVLAVSVAMAQAAVATWLRRLAPHVPRIAGGLVLVAGLFAVWFGWFEIRVLTAAPGERVSDPVGELGITVQSWAQSFVGSLGTDVLLGLVAVVLLLAVLAAALNVRRARLARRAQADSAGVATAPAAETAVSEPSQVESEAVTPGAATRENWEPPAS